MRKEGPKKATLLGRLSKQVNTKGGRRSLNLSTERTGKLQLFRGTPQAAESMKDSSIPRKLEQELLIEDLNTVPMEPALLI